MSDEWDEQEDVGQRFGQSDRYNNQCNETKDEWKNFNDENIENNGRDRGRQYGEKREGNRPFNRYNNESGGGDFVRHNDRARERFNEDNGNNNKGEENGEEGEKKKTEFYIPPEPTNDEEEMFNSGISSGINFAKFESIPVNVSGDNVPEPILKFETSGLRSFLVENIKKSGYSVPTPIQKHAIPIIAAKRDLMACAQTGSGKTAAFLLPVIETLLEEKKTLTISKPQALVVSPTRELAIQIFSEARKFAHGSILKICISYGGTSSKHQGDNIGKGCHMLIATPGRLMDFVDRGYVSFEELKFFILDEADRMLDLGFMPIVEKLMNHPTMAPRENRLSLMFSATFPEAIQRIAGQFLNNYIFLTIGIVGGACSDVEQNFYEVQKFQKKGKLMEILEENTNGGIMVFVETKRNADFLASFLSETVYPTTSIHGDRMQRERELALNDFKSGRMQVLIATSVAARGLDIKNVSHVINYDLPKSIDEYVHRIGRTGRVGNRGKATSFFDPEHDANLIPDLAKILSQANQNIPDFINDGASYAGYGGGVGNRFGARDVRGARGGHTDTTIGSPVSLEEEDAW